MRFLFTLMAVAMVLLVVQFTPPVPSSTRSLSVAQASANPPGVVFVNPPNVANQTIGTEFNVTVQVSGMDSFTSWDILVLATNNSATNKPLITPINMSITGNFFATNDTSYTAIVFTECVNGKVIKGNTCRQGNGPGIAELAEGLPPGAPAPMGPIGGPLFNITYKVLAFGGYSTIHFSAVTFVNGPTTIADTPQDGSYGTPQPDFTLSLSTHTITVTQGSHSSLTVSLQSVLKFNGTISFRVSGSLTGVFDYPSLNLTWAKGSNSTKLTLTAPFSLSPTSYVISVIANYTTTGLSHTDGVQVSVRPPGSFTLGFDYQQIPIQGGFSGNVTILLESTYNFSGEVDLYVNTARTNVTYSLQSRILDLKPFGSNFTIITLSPPVEYSKVIFYVFVTAAHHYPTFWQNVTEPIEIVPPAPTLAITTNPVQLSILAGQGSNVTITVWSVDYFYGYAYVSAVMQGGKASFDHYSYFFPLPNSTQARSFPSENYTLALKIGARTIPGNYVILITAYSITNGNQTATSTQASILLTITNPTLYHTASVPVSILGQTPRTYFMILGVVAIPFAILGAAAVRKWKDDQDQEYLRD